MPADRVKTALDELNAFASERGWTQFHSAENLAKSISIEAGELLECFQWSTDANDQAVREELADVLTYCFFLAQAIQADPVDLIETKLEVTRHKYPIDITYGRSTKSAKLQD